MCEMPQFSHREIEFALFHSKLNKVTRKIIYFYFTKVRIIQVKYRKEPVYGQKYICESCECRLSMKNCSNRLDTCFKKKRNGENIEIKLHELENEHLVRTVVNTGNFHIEICHCCWCCCFPIIIYNFLGFGMNPSGYIPVKNDNLCKKCGICYRGCPVLAINKDFFINRNICLGCGLCEMDCPNKAINMEKIRDMELYTPNKLISFIFLLNFSLYVKMLFFFNNLKTIDEWSI